MLTLSNGFSDFEVAGGDNEGFGQVESERISHCESSQIMDCNGIQYTSSIYKIGIQEYTSLISPRIYKPNIQSLTENDTLVVFQLTIFICCSFLSCFYVSQAVVTWVGNLVDTGQERWGQCVICGQGGRERGEGGKRDALLTPTQPRVKNSSQRHSRQVVKHLSSSLHFPLTAYEADYCQYHQHSNQQGHPH